MNPTAPTPELPDKLRDLFEQYVAAGRLELPFLPTTATQVLGACNEGSCDARELSELIQTDQSLAGHVLRIANSAAYAPLEPIVSLQQATSRLGMQTMCEIALAVSMKGRVFKVPGYQTKVRAMWVHSAMAGCYAKEIARKIRHNVEGAFLCGLLHDVGKPVVMQGFLDILKDMTTEKVHVLENGKPVVKTVTRSPWGCRGFYAKTGFIHGIFERKGLYRRARVRDTELLLVTARETLDVTAQAEVDHPGVLLLREDGSPCSKEDLNDVLSARKRILADLAELKRQGVVREVS